MSSTGALDVAARTHPGRVRPSNEDCLVVDERTGRFAVIDGMGGNAFGAVAAGLVRDSLLHTDGDLVAAINTANQSICADAAAHPERTGMGAVVTAAVVHASSVRLAHVGDTRAYLASELGTEQLTRDHTAVAERQEAMGLTDAQAARLHQQHAVTRDVGRRTHRGDDWIETSTTAFGMGDVLLLCSDGLYGSIGRDDLFGLLLDARSEQLDSAVLADELLKLALVAGGPDNISLIVVRRRMGSAIMRIFGSLSSRHRS